MSDDLSNIFGEQRPLCYVACHGIHYLHCLSLLKLRYVSKCWICFSFFLFQLLALANGDRIKDNQRSRNSFVVDIDKKVAAEHLLQDVSHHHGPMIRQVNLVFIQSYASLTLMPGYLAADPIFFLFSDETTGRYLHQACRA